MTTSLAQILFSPDTQPQLVADCRALIGQEMAELSGVSGTAVKLAYKTVDTFMPGHVQYLMEALLPQFVDKLEPHWAEFRSSGSSEFGDYLAKHSAEVSQDLLAVTDECAAESERPVIIKAYKSVRSSAARHIEAALPRVGDLIEKLAT